MKNKTVYLIFVAMTLCFFLYSSSVKSQVTETNCLDCHNDQTLTMDKNGTKINLFVDKGILDASVHNQLKCEKCHVGFDPENIPHKKNIQPINCMTCHNDANLKHLFHPQIAQAKGIETSKDVSCKGCHGTHNVEKPIKLDSEINLSSISKSCGICHSKVINQFNTSAHGIALSQNVDGAPTCLTCHRKGTVIIPDSKNSVQIKINQEKMCLSCHMDKPEVRSQVSSTAGFIAAYDTSVHGSALKKGNANAANCVDCHGSHQIKKGSESDSLVSHTKIPSTCAHCHKAISQEYASSIHGVAASKGAKDAPVCTDCHREHNILSPNNPNSSVSAQNVSSQVCSPCHSSVKLSDRYGLASDRFKTFSDSFHGLAAKAGSTEVANCASCHGVHNIKPSSDPTSMVHKSNLSKTCGKCHPGANERFTIGSVHVVAKQEPLLKWVSKIYILMILGTVGGMTIHNLLDFIKKARHKIKVRQGLILEEPVGRGLYVRMTLIERIQHISLIISFIVLVITGFMLRYPDAWWIDTTRNFSESIFNLRGLLHRIAAVVMILAGAYHIYYVTFTKRGRKLIWDLLPRWSDFTDMIGVLMFNIGFSSNKPKLGRFSYIEKAEYWALIWGSVVMGVTGVILWFDNTFMGLITKLGWDVARTIHFYEAWLAVLAIIVWHFYFVLLNPDIYPMNLAWLTGTLSESEMRDEHPLELERIQKEEMEKEMEETKDKLKDEYK